MSDEKAVLFEIVDCDGDKLTLREAGDGVRDADGDLILIVREQYGEQASVLLDRGAVRALHLGLEKQIRRMSPTTKEERETCAAMAEAFSIIYPDGVPAGLSFNPFKKLADEIRKKGER